MFCIFRKTMFRSKYGVQTTSLRRKDRKKHVGNGQSQAVYQFFFVFLFLLPFKIPLVYLTEKLVFSRFLCSQRYTVPERSVMNVFFCKLRLILLTQLSSGEVRDASSYPRPQCHRRVQEDELHADGTLPLYPGC